MPELPPRSDSEVLVILSAGVWSRVTDLLNTIAFGFTDDDDGEPRDLDAADKGAALSYLIGHLEARAGRGTDA